LCPEEDGSKMKLIGVVKEMIADGSTKKAKYGWG
jgi:hypothetical protein